MDDLVAWLSEQVDEDERMAKAAQGEPVEALVSDAAYAHLRRHGPARVLAEVAAKRRIIDRFAEEYAIAVDYSRAVRCSTEEWHLVVAARDTLRDLASVYAHRPGYREEWAPDAEADHR